MEVEYADRRSGTTDFIIVDDTVRLRKFDGYTARVVSGSETVWLVDGDKRHNEELLGKMYTYLNGIGELYFIEVYSNGTTVPSEMDVL